MLPRFAAFAAALLLTSAWALDEELPSEGMVEQTVGRIEQLQSELQVHLEDGPEHPLTATMLTTPTVSTITTTTTVSTTTTPAFSTSAASRAAARKPSWKPWTLPPDMVKNFPSKLGSQLDPSRFHLRVKLLTFNRIVPTTRFLNSLLKVDFMGDRVSLDVYVDHPFSAVAGWGEKTEQEQQEHLRLRNDMLAMLDNVEWRHGRYSIHAREMNTGMQPQWLEAWYPRDVNEFTFIAEDDMEVSPFMYTYFKKLVMFYYYNQSNFDPRVYGISFQRQWQVPGINGREMVYPDEIWLNPLVGTWGQFLFPIQWKQFRVWYEDNRFNADRDPSIGKMITTLWWKAKGNKIWTTWHIRWAYVNQMYTIYTGFPPNMSLSVSHRTSGTNYNDTLGPDADLITAAHLPPGIIRPVDASGIPTGEPVSALPANTPAWWTHMPPSDRIRKYDYCMRQLPSRRTPVRSLEELKSLLPMFGAEKDLAVVPVPGTYTGYQRVRNWLCHTDGLDRHNHLLLFSQLPTSLAKGAEPACKEHAQHWNFHIEVAASDLAARGHLVYIVPAPAWAKLTRDQPCSRRGGKAMKLNLLNVAQAGVVNEVLKAGTNVLVASLGSLYNKDPFQCFEKFASASNPDMATWLLMNSPKSSAKAELKDATSLVMRIQSTAAGQKAFATFLAGWQAAGASELTSLNAGKLALLESGPSSKVFVLRQSKPVASSAPAFETCVVSAHAPSRVKSGAIWWYGKLRAPGVVLAPSDIKSLKKMDFWATEDVYHSCKTVWCEKR